MDYDREALERQLKKEEGEKNRVYRDRVRTPEAPNGYLTVGDGWNLDTNGIPPEVQALLPEGDPLSLDFVWPEAAITRLLDIGIAQAEKVLTGFVPGWRDLDDVRQRALLDMSYNMGHRLTKFPNFLRAVNAGDWTAAATELDVEHSPKWHQDVGPRADRVMVMIGTGISEAVV